MKVIVVIFLNITNVTNNTASDATLIVFQAKVYSAKQLEQIRRAKEGWVSNKYQRVELTPLQTAWFKSLGEPAANKSEKLGKSQGYTAAGSSQCFGPVLTRKVRVGHVG